MSTHRAARPLAEVVLAWTFAAALGAAAAGALDALWSWGHLGQFAPGALTRIRIVSFTASLYAVAAAVVAVPLSAVLTTLVRYSDLRLFVAAWSRSREEGRTRGPGHGARGLAVTIAAVITGPAALGAAFRLMAPGLSLRRHLGLIIFVAMLGGAVAAVAAAIATAVLSRPLTAAFSRLARWPRPARVIDAPVTPLWAALAIITAAIAVAIELTWSVTQHLPVRVGIVLWLAVVATVAARRAGDALASRLPRRRWRRTSALAGGAVLLVTVALVTGGARSVQKAGAAYTALSQPLSTSIRRMVDVDRDGFSPVLAGGDCDDFARGVNPRVSDAPGDGIDQNCVGGDAQAPAPTAPEELPVPSSVPRPLSVVLITIDTLRADHLGAYGYARPTSPNLDALGREGAVFENAWAHAPSTRYSIPAILTGRYPLAVYYDTSIRGWPGLLPRGDSVGEIMKKAGLFTGGILNYWYFGRERHMDRGFDFYDDTNRRLHKGIPGKGPAETQGSSSREQTDKAIQFLDAHGQEPFFLWIHYYDPHYDYEHHPGGPRWGDAPVDRYDEEIHYTDQHIGRLLDTLRRRGLYDHTAIVVTGDHGEGFGEHGVELHGYHLYRAQTKVPLIIRVPGLAPSRPTTPVGHVDILPTLANLVGVPTTEAMQGRSLVGILADGDGDAAHADGWVFQQLSYENHHEMRAAASQRCHVIYNVSPATSWELYRVDRDPDETRDVIGQPGTCAEAQTTLGRWYDSSEIPEGAEEALATGTAPDRLGLSLGDAIRVLSVDVPAAVRRGQSLPVTYTFAATGRLSDAWRVFAHFESPNGGRFTDDHEPTRPFSWWKAGQIVRYTRQVSIPPQARPGQYSLWMGVFRGSHRLPARSTTTPVKDDRAQVATFTIQ